MARGGPKTDAGKAVARYNAAIHGLTAQVPVIPGLERQEDWERHLAGFQESLQPVGDFENFLVERIAYSGWCMRRCSAYETAALGTARSLAREDAKASLSGLVAPALEAGALDVEAALERAKSLRDLLFAIYDNDGKKVFSDEDVALLADGIRAPLEALFPVEHFHVAELISELLGCAGETAREVAKTLGMLDVVRFKYSSFDLSAYLLQTARNEVMRLEQLVGKLGAEVDRLLAERMLLDDRTVAKVRRYEAHHRRQFTQYLHELEAAQSRRRGEAAPLARLDVQVIGSETEPES